MNTKLYLVSLLPYRIRFPHLSKRQLEREAGETTIRNVMSFLLHRQVESKEICRNPKPFLANCPYQFNLSHSGDYLVLAVGDVPIGVDIEKITRVRPKVMERYFSDSEKEKVAKEGADAFYEIWTKKESYIKYTGNGLKDLEKTQHYPPQIDFFSTVFESYRITVCSEWGHLPNQIEIL